MICEGLVSKVLASVNPTLEDCAAQVLEMLENGETPPGIRADIVDTPPDPAAPPPPSRLAARPKPWERSASSGPPPGAAACTATAWFTMTHGMKCGGSSCKRKEKSADVRVQYMMHCF